VPGLVGGAPSDPHQHNKLVTDSGLMTQGQLNAAQTFSATFPRAVSMQFSNSPYLQSQPQGPQPSLQHRFANFSGFGALPRNSPQVPSGSADDGRQGFQNPYITDNKTSSEFELFTRVKRVVELKLNDYAAIPVDEGKVVGPEQRYAAKKKEADNRVVKLLELFDKETSSKHKNLHKFIDLFL
jgi:hypothetical protein